MNKKYCSVRVTIENLKKSRSLIFNFIIMKKSIFKSVLPLVTVLLAVFGAFAFNADPTEELMTVDMIGVIPDSCEDSSTVCSTIFNTQQCQEGSQLLHRWNEAGTACPNPLYRKQ